MTVKKHTRNKTMRVPVRHKDDVFQVLLGLIHSHGHLSRLAKQADVSTQTLYNWMHKSVTYPRLSTVIKVAKALGYKVRLVKR